MDLLSATSLIYIEVEPQIVQRLRFLGKTPMHTYTIRLQKGSGTKGEEEGISKSIDSLSLTWLKTRN